MTEIAVAYDVETLEQALALDTRLGPGSEIAKIGLQLFTAAGPDVVRALRERGRRVFLDLKLHDIPNTVAGAAGAAAKLGAQYLTVHAMGGYEMVAAAVRASSDAGGEMKIVAVTILTSLNAFNVPPGFVTPFHSFLVIPNLLAMSERAGAHGIVCSAADLKAVRSMHPAPFFAATPGIRAAGAEKHDQQRVATVAEAVAAGSDMLVIGRPITGAPDPRAALAAIRAECDAAAAVLQP